MLLLCLLFIRARASSCSLFAESLFACVRERDEQTAMKKENFVKQTHVSCTYLNVRGRRLSVCVCVDSAEVAKDVLVPFSEEFIYIFQFANCFRCIVYWAVC